MPLTEAELNSIVDALQAQGGIIDDVKWLAENEACDIYFAVLSAAEAKEMLAHLLANVPFDFVIQTEEGRKKKLLICDMDSTIIEQECIDELADFIGKKEEVSQITARAMNGELEFKSALRERVALLEGLPVTKLDETFEKRITIMPGAKELITTMKENGARTVLVSGGFTFFTERVQQVVGFDVQEANILEIDGTNLSGKVREPILDKTAKLNALLFYSEEIGINTHSALAVGDGANDLPMLMEAGMGVAYHAHPNVKAQTRAKIDHCDLRSLLYIQGYKKLDFRG